MVKEVIFYLSVVALTVLAQLVLWPLCVIFSANQYKMEVSNFAVDVFFLGY